MRLAKKWERLRSGSLAISPVSSAEVWYICCNSSAVSVIFQKPTLTPGEGSTNRNRGMSAKIQVKRLQILQGHKQGVYALCVDPEGHVLSSGGDGLMVRWNYPESEHGKAIASIPEPVYCLVYSNGYVLAGTHSGNLYAVVEGSTPRKLEAHKGGIYVLHALQHGYFLSAGGDGKAILWNNELEIVLQEQISSKPIRSFVDLGKNGVYAFGCSDWKIHITSHELKPVEMLEGHEQSVFSLAYYREQNVLFSGGRDAVLRSWDLNSANEFPSVAAHLFHIHSMELNPSQTLLATASMDKTIKLWDPIHRELLKVIDIPKFEAHKSSVNNILWLNDHLLVSASDDRTIMVWEVDYS